jgi:hypothetical protein
MRDAFKRVSGAMSTDVGQNAELRSVEGLKNICGALDNGLGMQGNPLLDNLSGLECVTSLGGNQFGVALQIDGMAGLTDVKALSHLTKLGGSAVITNNALITSISALLGVESVGKDKQDVSLVLDNNAKLEKCDAFWATSEFPGGVQATNSPALKSMDCLNGVVRVGKDVNGIGIMLYNAPKLADAGMDAMKSISGSIVAENTGIAYLTIPAESLGTSADGKTLVAGGNPNLVGIDISKAKVTGGSVQVYDNEKLQTIDAGALASIGADSGGVSLELKNVQQLTKMDQGKLTSLAGSVALVGTGLEDFKVAGSVCASAVAKKTANCIELENNNALKNPFFGNTQLQGGAVFKNNDELQTTGLGSVTSVGANNNGQSLVSTGNKKFSTYGAERLLKTAGSIVATQLPAMEMLLGLDKVEVVGADVTGTSLELANNQVLKTIGGLRSCSKFEGALVLQKNPVLATLEGLQKLTELGCPDCQGRNILGDSILIYSNPELKSLSGLENLHGELAGAISISNNPKLISIEALKGIRNAGANVAGTSLELVNNKNLKDLVGLDDIQAVLQGAINVQGNGISSLKGLCGVSGVAGQDLSKMSVNILNNEQLTDISCLSHLGGALKGGLNIAGNPIESLTPLLQGSNPLASSGGVNVNLVHCLTVADHASLARLCSSTRCKNNIQAVTKCQATRSRFSTSAAEAHVLVGEGEGRTCGGTSKASGWKTWSKFGTSGLFVDVDTSSCNFEMTPAYVSSVMGDAGHFQLVGVNSIYSATKKSFRVYLWHPVLRGEYLRYFAERYNWSINWLADTGRSAGITKPGVTGWKQFAKDTIFVDVDTTKCGYKKTPSYVTAIHGSYDHWRVQGVHAVYTPTATGFRVYVASPAEKLSAAEAETKKWALSWVGSEDSRTAGTSSNEWTMYCASRDSGCSATAHYYSLYNDVDTSSHKFYSTPTYVSSISGLGHHLITTGGAAVYRPMKDSFRVYLEKAPTPLVAKESNWRVNYIGYEQPIACEVSQWGGWSTCTQSCGGGSHTRTRTVTREPNHSGVCDKKLSDSGSCNDDKCPIDCVMTIWDSWSTCGKSCDAGFQSRTRNVLSAAQFGGKVCGSKTQTRYCHEGACPVHCSVSDWGSWNGWSTSCGSGQRTRTRFVQKTAEHGGYQCPSLVDVASRSSSPCPIDCVAGEWTPLSECSVTCGAGKQVRTRPVNTPAAHGGKACNSMREEVPCTRATCPVDCVMNDWSDWSLCSKSCGQGGTQFATRSVASVASNGGKACGSTKNTMNCYEGPCPVHCAVSAWTTFTSCSRTCGGGEKTRTRTVITHAKHGGYVCPLLSETDSCNIQPCAVDCDQSAWSAWSSCTKTCGTGSTTRTRQTLTATAHGGVACGPVTATRACNAQCCPVDCDVSDWGAPSACSKTCGVGSATYARQVSTAVACGGKTCPALSEERPCNNVACPVHCAGVWSKWSSCSHTCGSGTSFRTHTVTAHPEHGGSACPNQVATEACNETPCPVDCVLEVWTQWSGCSASCGAGVSTRTRSLSRSHAHGGKKCSHRAESKACNTHACPVDCLVSPWSGWGACSKSCNTGMQVQERAVVRPTAFGGVACLPLSASQPCATHCCPGQKGFAGNCVECAAGQYQDNHSMQSCKHCFSGHYQDTIGQQGCKACEKGKKGDANLAVSSEAHCVNCTPGKYQQYDGKSDCVQCAAGQYLTDHKSPGPCTVCPAGQYTAGQAGSISCHHIPINCVLAESWNNWGSCSKTCGGGIQTRTKDTVTPAMYGGTCPATVDTRGCSMEACPVDCLVSGWESWSACTAPCGGGSKSRARMIQRVARNGGKQCPALDQIDACNAVPCAVHCVWGSYGPWTPCPTACGKVASRRYRSRSVAVASNHGGDECQPADKTEVGICADTLPCPVHCTVSDWTDGQCSMSCGGGKRTRTRRVTTEAAHGGVTCGLLSMDVDCATEPCPDNCVFAWDSWSTCDKSCGYGLQQRNMRVTREPQFGGKSCPTQRVQTRLCSAAACPQDCVMDSWSAWSVCTKSCDGGRSTRHRTPLYLPANGGVQCGTTTEVISCSEGPCPVHCAVSSWSPMSACSVTCGSGHQKRTRTVITANEGSGAVCPFLEEKVTCGADPCPADCVVGEWQQYEACDATCGGGRKSRTRWVVTQAAHGGVACPQTKQLQVCNAFACPIDCSVAAWGSWTACPRTCGIGHSTRTRQLVRNALYGGKQCGSTTETKQCSVKPCPVDCQTDSWSAWDACSKSCGGGKRERFRSVVTPVAAGGKSCPHLTEIITCGMATCPVDCKLTAWSEWGTCTKSCGGNGMQTRTRKELAQGAYGGFCGDLEERRTCGSGPCPDECTVAAWSSWSACTASCGGGQRLRSRTVTHQGAHSKCPSLEERSCCNTATCPMVATVAAIIHFGGETAASFSAAKADALATAVANVASMPSKNDVSTKVVANGAAFEVHATVSVTSATLGDSEGAMKPLWRHMVNIKQKEVYGALSASDTTSRLTAAFKSAGIALAGSVGVMSVDSEESNYPAETPSACGASAPRDCEVGDFSKWSACSKTCGHGVATSVRAVLSAPANGGATCPVTKKYQSCKTNNCPLDCKMSAFGPWSLCSKQCGGGKRTRFRSIDRNPKYGGTVCGNLQETGVCNSQSCPVDCVPSAWQSTGICSKQCGGGIQVFTRTVVTQRLGGGAECDGFRREEPCNTFSCPINCLAGSWSQWAPCSKSCGGGIQDSTRAVTRPASDGGTQGDCNELYKYRSCNSFACSGTCSVGSWSDWTECSKSCGIGTQSRSRAVRLTGAGCPHLKEERQCNYGVCVIPQTAVTFKMKMGCQSLDSFTAAKRSAFAKSIGEELLAPPTDVVLTVSATPAVAGECGRRRLAIVEGVPTCTAHKGSVYAMCGAHEVNKWGVGPEGEAQAIKNCNYASAYKQKFGDCTAHVASNLSINVRVVIAKDAAVALETTLKGAGFSGALAENLSANGLPMSAKDLDVDQASIKASPAGCSVGAWSTWGGCSMTCGSGMKNRSRDTRSINGGTCPTKIGQVECQTDACPVHCKMMEWSSWGVCTANCGAGQQTRTRSVSVQPSAGGSACGKADEARACNTSPCVMDCVAGAWEPWTSCSKTCGGGLRQSARSVLHAAQNGGKACTSLERSEACATALCQEPCRVSTWGSWSVCTRTCGSGSTTRARTVLSNPTNAACDELSEVKFCNTLECKVDCKMSVWGSWTPCTAECGSGVTMRTRQVMNAAQGSGAACEAHSDVKSCNTHTCSVDCVPTAWTAWSKCSKSCDAGVTMRSRSVHIPASSGGKTCEQQGYVLSEAEPCVEAPCVADCTYSSWSEFSPCSKSCGGGVQFKVRSVLTFGTDTQVDCSNKAFTTHAQSCNSNACSVDCVQSAWSAWSQCSTSCGTGTRTRKRSTVTAPASDGSPCGASVDATMCATKACPTDCMLTEWGEFSQCTNSCGTGTRARTRGVRQAATNGGKACGALENSESCNFGKCAVHCAVSAWSSWSNCALSCGGGMQFRSRVVLEHGANGGTVCPFLQDNQSCNSQPCPVDCKMGAWNEWSVCSASCGTEPNPIPFSFRHRAIEVAAAHGGKACAPQEQKRSCNAVDCVQDCIVSTWTAWSDCSVTCEAGKTSRLRNIVTTARAGGKACPSLSQTEHCNVGPCPVECEMSQFSDWTACTKSCGGGDQQRTRTMLSQSTANSKCPHAVETRSCNDEACPADCKWSWGAWSACPVTCGGGEQVRLKKVLSVSTDGGVACGPAVEAKNCATTACPVDCKMSQWGGFNQCSFACGGGFKQRSRATEVTSSGGGALCGALVENVACNTKPCAVDCVVAEWGAWTACDKTCGFGTKSRRRSIVVDNANGGKKCPALGEEGSCNQHMCPVNCVQTMWSTWSSCTATCGQGAQTRQRETTRAAVFGGIPCFASSQSRACSNGCCAGFRSGGGSGCTACPKGFFQDNVGRENCGVCPSGKYADKQGQHSCTTCPKGHYGDYMRSTTSGDHCVQCAPGLYQQKDGSEQCVECPRDTYINVVASPRCEPCPAGTSTLGLAGQTECKLIPEPCTLGSWLDWSDCTKTCGRGAQVRRRPLLTAARNGGACSKLSEVRACAETMCPTDCQQYGWGVWSACSATCGTGIFTRSRRTVHPTFGGKACGASLERGNCSAGPCPVDCQLSAFSAWSQCTTTCGGGNQHRNRAVLRAPVANGVACAALTETRSCAVAACAIDCVLAAWGSWSPCTKSCGLGSKDRQREISVSPAFGGKACTVTAETAGCNANSCPVDCVNAVWGAWSACSKSCAGGTYSRQRAIKTVASFGGKLCTVNSQDSICNTLECPVVACTMNSWGSWNSCSKTCGRGIKKRTRTVKTATDDTQCPHLNEVVTCNGQVCAVDCVTTAWTAWSDCSNTCGGGVQSRARTVTTPTVASGKACGAVNEQRMCKQQTCPVDCIASMWGSYGACSKTCGAAVQTRFRSISRMSLYGGVLCPTELSESTSCIVPECPVDCVMGQWSVFTKCSKDCGGGQRSRARTIVRAASNGGAQCGTIANIEACNDTPCPVDCVMQDWSLTVWGKCDASCNGGQRVRTRVMLAPAFYGGKVCGAAAQIEQCNNHACPSDCEMHAWSIWSSCSASCKMGWQTRSRAIKADAANGGKACGPVADKQECNAGPCPVHCAVTMWGQWTACSKTCDNGGARGTQQRARSVISPSQNNGQVCPSLTSKRECAALPCPVDCVPEEWGLTWPKCSVSCGGGIQTRRRGVASLERHGGKACSASMLVAVQACNVHACPIDCALSQWSSYTTCSMSCGGGHQSRARTVDVATAYGGKMCGNLNHVAACNIHPCPVDCATTSWGVWSTCSQSCGGGERTRARFEMIATAYGGAVCPPLTFTESCNSHECPIDCVLAPWAAWDTCSHSCGGGSQSRSRGINRAAAYGGKQCDKTSEIGACNSHACPVDCLMGAWDSWSACSTSCGVGVIKRSRVVARLAAYGGVVCGPKVASGACNLGACPVHCVVSQFGPWSACTKSCGAGKSTRQRAVVRHATSGGYTCPFLSEDRLCNTAPCPVDCVVSDWAAWSVCSRTCGAGEMSRSRTGQRSFGGKVCPHLAETVKCNEHSCPSDCVPGAWGAWGACSVTCATGTQTRTRPVAAAATFGGKTCGASLTHTRACTKTACPIHCAMAQWAGWTTCTATCAGGMQSRVRVIATQPQFGGLACNHKNEAQTCNTFACPVNCVSSSWGSWAGCSTTCGSGVQQRARSVVSAALHGGAVCGAVSELRPCENLPGCPVHCEVSGWNSWTPCTKTCGVGTRSRSRSVTVHQANAGRGCPALEDVEACGTSACPVDCKLTLWTTYGACSKTCSEGTQTRSRSILTATAHGGVACGALTEVQKCDKGPCPIHCRVSMFTPWSACTKSCGTGAQSRSRVILTNPLHEGDECPNLRETQNCQIQPCPIDCNIGDWGSWGACSGTCHRAGAATPSRKRARPVLVAPSWGGVACPTEQDTSTCNAFECPVDCVVAPWAAWGACSATCSNGIKVRVRGIDVNPAYGGRSCDPLAETGDCNDGPCPIHCQVSEWAPWATCSKSCGGGKQSRTRTILTNPLHSGDQCPFLLHDRQCNMQPCVIDCEVSAWGGWHPTLGGGVVLTRNRQITTPVAYGGQECPKLSEQDAQLEASWNKQCLAKHKKDVYYGWSVCSKSCGTGYQYRYREHVICSERAALRYHAMFREGRHCNMQACASPVVQDTVLDESLVSPDFKPAYLRHTAGTWADVQVHELAKNSLPMGQWQAFHAL